MEWTNDMALITWSLGHLHPQTLAPLRVGVDDSVLMIMSIEIQICLP
jgi:hypothetical protein